MNNSAPTKPSYIMGYWRPWETDSNAVDSYLDYAKDVSLAKYSADTVGTYINQASKKQISAIDDLSSEIGVGINILSNKLTQVNQNLFFINKNLDVLIEQQRISNILLQDISDLLKIPDYEKERQHSIELGLKFFMNAQKNSELFGDSLEEFLKAESLMKQDYFVLHRIGCIYMYVEKFINPEKALDYFLRAAKYASVESDVKNIRTFNALTINTDKNKTKHLKNDLDDFEANFEFENYPSLEDSEYNGWYIEDFTYLLYTVDSSIEDGYECEEFDKIYFRDLINTKETEEDLKFELINIQKAIDEIISKHGFITNNLSSINSLAADSYEKSAFSSYVLGAFDDAVTYQKNAVDFFPNSRNNFFLAKYLVRNGCIVEAVEYLSQAIDECPSLAIGTFKEIDLVNEQEVLNLIEIKNNEINHKINELIKKWESVDSIKAKSVIKELNESLVKPYDLKVEEYFKFKEEASSIKLNINKLSNEIDKLIEKVKKEIYCTFNNENLIKELNNLKSLPVEKMDEVFNRFKSAIKNDKLKLGARYAGGIVFYIDDSGKHGLICAEEDFEDAIWGGDGLWNKTRAYDEAIGKGFENTKIIVENASSTSGGIFSSPKPIKTAARLCLESKKNGYINWYLPSIDELKLLNDYNITCINNGIDIGLNKPIYWSSTDCEWNADYNDNVYARALYFQYVSKPDSFFGHKSGEITRENKNEKLGVRAIRAF